VPIVNTRNLHPYLPQLQLEFPAAQWGRTAQRVRARGINAAIGLDEAGINDHRDMLQETRMVLRAHRVPGMEDADVPSPGQVLRMATVGGAATTPFGSHIGTLAIGKAADLVLIDWEKLAYPYLDSETPVLDAVIQRAKSDEVDLVMVAGEVVYESGRFTRVDRDAAVKRIARVIATPAR
jgi:5-methylthioadenosine/S-adenosylhomocysteine deaminase